VHIIAVSGILIAGPGGRFKPIETHGAGNKHIRMRQPGCQIQGSTGQFDARAVINAVGGGCAATIPIGNFF
jgi:hypothetical protein